MNSTSFKYLIERGKKFENENLSFIFYHFEFATANSFFIAYNTL